jgi:hypothetical protein
VNQSISQILQAFFAIRAARVGVGIRRLFRDHSNFWTLRVRSFRKGSLADPSRHALRQRAETEWTELALKFFEVRFSSHACIDLQQLNVNAMRR